MRNTFDRTESALRWTAALAAAVVLALLVGSTQSTRVAKPPPSPPPPTLDGMFASYDQPRLDPEPSGDSSGGVYLCHIIDISGSPTLSVTVDLITDEWQPGTTQFDRERSSWPDRVGHNRFVHPQELVIPGSVMATTDNGHELHVAGPAAFIKWWRADPSRRDENFYVRFNGSWVQNLWPWTY